MYYPHMYNPIIPAALLTTYSQIAHERPLTTQSQMSPLQLNFLLRQKWRRAGYDTWDCRKSWW